MESTKDITRVAPVYEAGNYHATTLDVVVGGQFGSESKGRVTAAIGVMRRFEFSTERQQYAVRVAGPNAGHVVIDNDGQRFALRQVPVAAVADPEAQLLIAAGSEIDPGVLAQEINDLERRGHQVRDRLWVDPEATIIEPAHQVAETALVGRIGSTGKGIGAARAARLMRTANRVQDEPHLMEALGLEDEQGSVDTAYVLNGALAGNLGLAAVVVEGTQGYGLGLHAGYYPQVTSSDCRAIDFLAMAGINPWIAPGTTTQVHVVARVYPIRVAGNSGPLRAETTWEELGLEAERTTVTQKIRRVGGWDGELLRRAVLANGGGGDLQHTQVKIHLAMVDQLIPEIGGVGSQGEFGYWIDKQSEDVTDRLRELTTRVAADGAAPIASLGTGPTGTVWLPPAILVGTN